MASTSGRSDEMRMTANALRRQVADDAVYLGLGAHVDAARRLVEDQLVAGVR
jgi:hypothetical protein